MTDTFLVADPHFGHSGVCRFLREDGTKLRPWDTPDEMDEALVDNWNKVVSAKDRVYVLGDVVINRRCLPILERVNGRLVLIKGNHDIFKLEDYAKYFDDIRSSHKLDNYILSHIPIHPDSLARWCGGNIHGHLHSNRVMTPDGKSIDPRYFSVSVEHTDFTPMSFNEVKLRFEKQKEEHNDTSRLRRSNILFNINTIKTFFSGLCNTDRRASN